MYIFLRDASGARHFNTSVSEKWADGERRNITRHFDALRKGAPSHARVNIDRDTLEYVEERDTFGDGPKRLTFSRLKKPIGWTL